MCALQTEHLPCTDCISPFDKMENKRCLNFVLFLFFFFFGLIVVSCGSRHTKKLPNCARMADIRSAFISLDFTLVILTHTRWKPKLQYIRSFHSYFYFIVFDSFCVNFLCFKCCWFRCFCAHDVIGQTTTKETKNKPTFVETFNLQDPIFFFYS